MMGGAHRRGGLYSRGSRFRYLQHRFAIAARRLLFSLAGLVYYGPDGHGHCCLLPRGISWLNSGGQGGAPFCAFFFGGGTQFADSGIISSLLSLYFRLPTTEDRQTGLVGLRLLAPCRVRTLWCIRVQFWRTGQGRVAGRIEPGMGASVLLGLDDWWVFFVFLWRAHDRRSLLAPTLAIFGSSGFTYLVKGAANTNRNPSVCADYS